MFDLLGLPFVQRGLAEVLLLAVAGGLLGTWIVLRGLAFFAHAVATATFPGLVVAAGIGVAPPVGAAVAAGAFTAGVAGATRGDRRAGHGTATALVLVAALGGGVILASDVFGSGASVESLLFGSLLVVAPGDVALAAGAAILAILGSALLGQRWLATGFDPTAARSLDLRSGAADLALLALVAAAAVAALAAVGALLATALLVVPAATARLLSDRVGPWQRLSIAIGAVEGILGLWLSIETDAPPGAAIAALAGVGFAAAAGLRTLPGPRRPAAAAVVLALAVAGLAAGGTARVASGSGGRLRVVASTTQLADFARRVAGPDAAVHQILRPNTDPHEYEPRPSDVLAVAGAQVVVVSGDGLDGWMGKVLRESGGHPRVLDAGAVVPVRRHGDPHWWHDPVNARAATRAIGAGLAGADPAHAAGYRRRATAYAGRLSRLRATIAACFATVPPGRRQLVTDHDAFGYFAGRFGIHVVGAVLPAQAGEAQASARSLARLARLVRREHVRAVFPQATLNASLVRAIAGQTGARADLRLYGDTLGAAGTPGATYAGMELANADAMVRGFTAGARGCGGTP